MNNSPGTKKKILIVEDDERDAAQAERPENHGLAIEQIGLYDLIEGEADQPGRDEGNSHAEEHGRIEKLPPIEHDHRGDGAELDGDLEALLKLALLQAQ